MVSGMKTMKLPSTILVLLGVLLLFISPVSAIDYSTWKDVTVNETPINHSSNTVFSLKIPPGDSILIEDTDIGPLTNVFNKNNPDPHISIVISDNPNGQKLDSTASRIYLDKFMLGAKISLIYGDQPQYMSNGGVMVYGTSGDKTLGIYVMSTDEKIITVTGFYNSLQDAKADVETLGMLAGSIQIAVPVS